jgi:hypothetical protein
MIDSTHSLHQMKCDQHLQLSPGSLLRRIEDRERKVTCLLPNILDYLFL